VTNETGVVADIELSAEERQSIYERLLRRNLIPCTRLRAFGTMESSIRANRVTS